MKKGYILTFDAIIALAVAVVLFMVVTSIQNSVRHSSEYDFKKLHYASEDAIEILNKKGVLDQVGTNWAIAAGNKDSPYFREASLSAKEYLSGIIPKNMGYRLYIGDDEICNDTRVPEDDSKIMTRSVRSISGYKPGDPVLGFVSRAYITGLKAKQTEKYINLPFVGHDGILKSDLLLEYAFDLPSDAVISSATWLCNMGWNEGGDDFCINGHCFTDDTISQVYWWDVKAFVNPGSNLVKVFMKHGDIYSGSYILVKYTTKELTDDFTINEGLPHIKSTQQNDCLCLNDDPLNKVGRCYRYGWDDIFAPYICCKDYEGSVPDPKATYPGAGFSLSVPLLFSGEFKDINARIHYAGANDFVSVTLNGVEVKRKDYNVGLADKKPEFEDVITLNAMDFIAAGVDLNQLSDKDNWLVINIDTDCENAWNYAELLSDSSVKLEYTPKSPMEYGDITFAKSDAAHKPSVPAHGLWDESFLAYRNYLFTINVPEKSKVYDAFTRNFYACNCNGRYEHYGMEAWSDGPTPVKYKLYEAIGGEGWTPVVITWYDSPNTHDTGYFHLNPDYVNQGGEQRYVYYREYPDDIGAGDVHIRDGSIFFANYKAAGRVPYGKPFKEANGGNFTVWYDTDQDGTADGSFDLSIGDNPDGFDPEDDAVDDAFMRLMDELNFVADDPDLPDGSKDNPIDVEITPEIKLESAGMGDVRSMWGPAIVKLVVWM